MPLTDKQEAFCKAVIKCKSYSDAYREAYDAENMSLGAVNVEASRLMADPNVTLRIDQLREEERNKFSITVEGQSKKLEAVAALAVQEKQTSGAVAAYKEQNRLFGLGTENMKVEGDGFIKVVLPE